MTEIIDAWFDLQNEWDEELFLSIPPCHRKTIPRCPNGMTFYASCCMDTFCNLLDRKIYTRDILLTAAIESIGYGNVKKLKKIIRTGDITDEDMVILFSNNQNLYMTRHYKNMLEDRPSIWERVRIGGMTLQEMCLLPSYLSKMLSICKDEEIDYFCLICPAVRDILSICGHKVPQSWAYRVGVTVDLFITCVRYNVSMEVLDIIVSRSSSLMGKDVKEFMLSYPPSAPRESVFYRCLTIMKMKEVDFLSEYMPDSMRMKQLQRLKSCMYPMCRNIYSNSCTLYGTDVEEIPSIFTITTFHGDASYLLDVREMKNVGDTYSHPYTREILDGTPIRERYMQLIQSEIPTSIDVDDVPGTISTYESVVMDMIEKNDLSLYTSDMVNIVCTYGQGTLLALAKHPTLIRVYGDSLAATIVNVNSHIGEIAKECI